MGLGILALGYLMVIFDALGGGFVGFPLLAVSFYKLAAVNKNFKTAFWLTFPAFGYSVVNLLVIFERVSSEGSFYRVCYCAYLAGMAALHFSFFTSLSQTAKKGGSMRLANGALSRLYLTEVFYFWALAVVFYPPLNAGVMSMLLIFFRYFIGFANLIFIYTCYTKMTTAEKLAEENALLSKWQKEKDAKRDDTKKK